MALVIAVVRLLLSLVFGVAGVTKLIDREGTREAVVNFGVPNSLAPAVAIVLPLLELAIAVGLLFSATSWWSALAGLLVLGLFIVAISVNLLQGKTHECHCFGQIYSRPLGWPTLARNVLFAFAAGLVIWQGAEFQPPLVSTLSAAIAGLSSWQLLILIAVAAAGMASYLKLRQTARSKPVNDQPAGLPIGAPAPEFDLPAYDGGRTSLSQLLAAGKPVLLIFTNPKCGPCITLFKEIGDWQTAHNDRLTIALITFGTIKDNFVNVARNNLGQVLLQEKHEVAELYSAYGTPTAVMIGTDGRILTNVAGGAEDIRLLLERHVQTAKSSLENIGTSNRAPGTGIHPTPAV